jgi:hypothetical protein
MARAGITKSGMGGRKIAMTCWLLDKRGMEISHLSGL